MTNNTATIIDFSLYKDFDKPKQKYIPVIFFINSEPGIILAQVPAKGPIDHIYKDNVVNLENYKNA